MRLPGYTLGQTPWRHECEVLFNGVDYGPDIQYSSFEFLPAKVRQNGVKVLGRSGEIDLSAALTGYPSYENMQGRLTMNVRSPQSWTAWDASIGGTKESRFLGAVNGRLVKIEFINSNGFYLMARPAFRGYSKYDLTWTMILDLEAQPYWLEGEEKEITWDLTPSTNYWNPSWPITVTANERCEYDDSIGGYKMTVEKEADLAPPSASITVNLPDPTAHYAFSCNPTSGGSVIVFQGGSASSGASDVTGTQVVISMFPRGTGVSLFKDFQLRNKADGHVVQPIVTLDMPLNSMHGTASAACHISANGREYTIDQGDFSINSLLIGPRRTTDALIWSNTDSSGSMRYQRGAFTCSL